MIFIENLLTTENKIAYIINKIIIDNDIPSDSFKAERLKKKFEKSDPQFVDIVYALIKQTNLKINKSKGGRIDLAHRNSESTNYYTYATNEIYWDFYNIIQEVADNRGQQQGRAVRSDKGSQDL